MAKTIEKKRRASGAGVKPDDGAVGLARKQVLLDAGAEKLLRQIGDGVLSLGIREAARRLAEHRDTAKFDLTRHLARAA